MTEEMFASIPTLVEQGLGTEEIAERFGVKATSLKVMCSNRSISLRRGGAHQPVRDLLKVSRTTARSLADVAKATGRKNSEQLIIDLLERIASDGLYRAVLDEEQHA
jgi:hypothetical protein